MVYPNFADMVWQQINPLFFDEGNFKSQIRQLFKLLITIYRILTYDQIKRRPQFLRSRFSH